MNKLSKEKEELITLAKKAGFKSQLVTDIPWSYSNLEDPRYCLWMDELTRWLRNNHYLELPIKSTPSFDIMEPRKWKGKIKFCFSPLRFTNNKVYVADKHEIVLEAMLIDALQLIDVTEKG